MVGVKAEEAGDRVRFSQMIHSGGATKFLTREKTCILNNPFIFTNTY